MTPKKEPSKSLSQTFKVPKHTLKPFPVQALSGQGFPQNPGLSDKQGLSSKS
jgi:hypothetical protein